ncbi:hypothetical protein DQ244_08250 [Blastococcus sp. TBT05-19]|uniref:DUF6049 family protein n=1 Tax=Blastococcus sp. TBT05-19 TaxID=2250581 RepID=UPI000DEBFC1B|nr:DUF6049 family protein [Blastococcus sp. TBT05-19]RBY92267.1 hypothetical protein DQ244_08250 [Blastococcus sp. TBT05-19]
MTRPAAARAGGRPAADASARPGAVRRAVALVPLVAGALALAHPLPAPAQAAPAVPGDGVDAERPVRIEVGRFEPRTVTPGSLITVTGTLTNTGALPITDLAVRLQRGEVRTTREELAAAVADPDPATTVLAPFSEVPDDLAPGASAGFSYTVPSDELRLERDGVYPALLNVNGTVDGDEQQRVGELSTFVVQQPVEPAARTAVAWLWPLSERSHRTPSGGFADDGLTEVVAEGGRLDRALAVVERLPTAAAPDGAAAPALQVTLAIDPALVEELSVMAEGPYAVDGEEDAGTGTDEARAFLERLRAVAAVHPVVALPYGDVDADSLQLAGLPGVVTRSLPGSPDGTAQDPPGAAPAPATPTADGAAPAEEEPPRTTGAGSVILDDLLDVTPVTDLAWAADGGFEPATLDVLRDGGVDRVVLAGDALTDGESAVGLDGSDAVAHSTLPVADGTIDVLVADPTLTALVGGAEDVPGGPRVAVQRYVAELAALTLQSPPGTEQTVLVAPPRDVRSGPDGAGAMMADTTGLPWLRAESVAGLGNVPVADAGEVTTPASVRRLDAEGMLALAEAVAVRDDLAGAVVGDAGVALQAYDAGIARSASVLRAQDPEAFRAAAEAARAAVDRLRGRVTVVAPADGTYTLASSTAPLVLTVDNDLPFAVQVLLQVRTRGSRGLSIGDIGVQTLAPRERTTLQVPTEVRQSGGFAVTAEVTTPSGGPLGERVDMQVKSTAYGSISLSITIGAASLLGLLFLRRFVNLVRRRRRGAVEGPELAPPGLAAPPTRSPV